MLACSCFQGRHTANKISDQVDETLACFRIDDKVMNITTDNASNMTKAFGLPGLESIKAKEEESDEDERMDYEETGEEHDPCYAHTHYS